MPIHITGSSSQHTPPPRQPGSQPGAGMDHVIRISSSTGRPIAGSVLIDSVTRRNSDASGRIYIPRPLLRDGPHTLRFDAASHQSAQMRVDIRAALDLRIQLDPGAGLRPEPAPQGDNGGGVGGDIVLLWGATPDTAPGASHWGEIDPNSPATLELTSDQQQDPIVTELSVSDLSVGPVCAILSGVGAGTAVTWTVVPTIDSPGSADPMRWIAAGPVLIADLPAATQAGASYSVTAEVGAQSYGPITLTITAG